MKPLNNPQRVPIKEMEPSTLIFNTPFDLIVPASKSILSQQSDDQQTAESAQCTITVIYAYTHVSFQKKIQLNQSIILMSDVIAELLKEGQIELPKEFAISYFDKTNEWFNYYGKFPFKETQVHRPLERANELTIKIRPILKMGNALRMEFCEEEHENHDEVKTNNFINEKSKRAKERKISFIINKVYMWRKMYNGFDYEQKDGTKQYRKFNLEEAATRIGISKKSLDDYLIQLRVGKTYGFDFNEHKNDKVGVLRAFVKMHKTMEDKGSNE